MKAVLLLLSLATLCVALEKPNIVFVITDDQGYGDLGCHGNPAIKTPYLDQLYSESSVLTDYHVAPTCSPTRASLLTGRWTNRTGAWHTVNGRSMLRTNEVTIAQMLKDLGYATGHFGKWHLGDNFPYRPEDRGFSEVFRHGGGGIGQTPDYWDNSYFDDHYTHNGKIVPTKGFCTDVIFEKANEFIKSNSSGKNPFFAYISTNAPHGPLHCPKKYMDLYPNLSPDLKAFFGMISNIDENIGKTRELLKTLGISENTIFIFTTDNGTAYGKNFYNANMSGQKGSALEGGHRVPFFLHWPAGSYDKHISQNYLTHAVDIVPTLLELTQSTRPKGIKLDGESLAKTLLSKKQPNKTDDRFLITDSQRVRDPIKWRESCVMQSKWRLINGTKLYNVADDPRQKNDIAKKHPEQVAVMRNFYEKWWTELEPTFAEMTEIYIGHPNEPIVHLNAHDWIQEEGPPWNQKHIRVGHGDDRGHWAIKVITAGLYEFELRRWPRELDLEINSGLAKEKNVPGSHQAFRTHKGKEFHFSQASLRIDNKNLGIKKIKAEDKFITFESMLEPGTYQLSPVFINEYYSLGTYYCRVELKE